MWSARACKPMASRRIAVVGAGLAGLSAAHRLHSLAGGDCEVLVIERDERAGGKVRTEHPLGLTVEGGPDSFLTRKPWAVDLCEELGLSRDLVSIAPAGRQSAIYWRRRLHVIPPGVMGVPGEAWPFLRTGLVTPMGKLRAAMDLVLPRVADRAEDRPLGEVVQRRLGPEVLRHMVEPLVAGIHAGSAWAMDAQATFPEFLELERRDRSLLLGAGRARRRRARGGAAAPVFQTLRGGLSQLVDELLARLPEGTVRCSTEVNRLTSQDGGYVLSLKGGGEERVDAVILASEAPASAMLLRDISPRAAVELFSIGYASVAVAVLAYQPEDFPNVVGSGFVVPKDAGLAITAASFVHNKWPHASPSTRLIRCFLGGSHEDPLQRSDEELLHLARRDLGIVLGVRKDPYYAAVFRWPKAMPQYAVGHPRRVRAAEEAISEHPRLRLAGSALRGVGMPDVIRSGRAAAEAVLEALQDAR